MQKSLIVGCPTFGIHGKTGDSILLKNPDDPILNGEDRQKSKMPAPEMARVELPRKLFLYREAGIFTCCRFSPSRARCQQPGFCRQIIEPAHLSCHLSVATYMDRTGSMRYASANLAQPLTQPAHHELQKSPD